MPSDYGLVIGAVSLYCSCALFAGRKHESRQEDPALPDKYSTVRIVDNTFLVTQPVLNVLSKQDATCTSQGCSAHSSRKFYQGGILFEIDISKILVPSMGHLRKTRPAKLVLCVSATY